MTARNEHGNSFCGTAKGRPGRAWRRLSGSVLALSIMAGAVSAEPDTTVKIGILNDQSGPYADGSGQGSVAMARLAIEDFGGEAFGHPVSVVVGDHQNKADIGALIVRHWIDVDKVNAVFDVPNAGVALAVQQVVRDRGGLFFTSGGGDPSFSGRLCSPYGFQWTFDTVGLANVAGGALARAGYRSWFLVQLDSTFGAAMSASLDKVVSAAGGRVVGRVRTPLNTADFSSPLLQAQASQAQLVALINAGADTINSVKQANEFGLPKGGQLLYTVILNEADAISIGLDDAKGLTTASPFYWAQSPSAEAVSRRFMKQTGRAPTWEQIGVYSAVLDYLRAAKAAGTLDRDAVAAKVHEMPVNDAYVTDGKVRITGRMLHETLLTRVKSPSEVSAGGKGPWDVFQIVSRVEGDQTAAPIDPSCPLVHGQP